MLGFADFAVSGSTAAGCGEFICACEKLVRKCIGAARNASVICSGRVQRALA